MTSPRNHVARSLILTLAAALVTLAGCDLSAPPQKDAPSTAPLGPIADPPGPLADRHPPPPGAGESWNTAGIEWFTWDAGLQQAQATHKPIVLVFHTTWCPHCKNYSHVFDDARIAQRAKDFVMVRVDADQDSDLAKRFSRDGGYIPRTFFLSPDGTPDFDIHAPRPQYAYFYDEHNAASLLAGMDEAAKKLRN